MRRERSPHYPGDPDVARDNTYIRGPILCLAISNEARLVGRIGSASGPRASKAPSRRANTCA